MEEWEPAVWQSCTGVGVLIRFPQALSLSLWQMFLNVTSTVTGEAVNSALFGALESRCWAQHWRVASPHLSGTCLSPQLLRSLSNSSWQLHPISEAQFCSFGIGLELLEKKIPHKRRHHKQNLSREGIIV